MIATQMTKVHVLSFLIYWFFESCTETSEMKTLVVQQENKYIFSSNYYFLPKKIAFQSYC